MSLRVNHFCAAGDANFSAIWRFLVVFVVLPDKPFDSLQLLWVAVSKTVHEATGECSLFPSLPAFTDPLVRFPFNPVKVFGCSFL